MTHHKYTIGDTVTFSNDTHTRAAASGPYRVIACRPMTGDGEPSYVVKSELERHDRVVAEFELR